MKCVYFQRSTFWLIVALAAFWPLAGTASTSLQITEIMFDPNNEDVWEWIEVRNTSGSPVDLHGALAGRLDDPQLASATPFIDNELTDNTVIPAGGVAVLYDADLPGITSADYLDQLFRDAWGLPRSAPLIGVRAFPQLVNSPAGGSIGFWTNFDDYQADLISDGMGGNKIGSFDNALFGIDYRAGFPAGNGKASIAWNGAGDHATGANWNLSSIDDGAATSLLVRAPGDIGNPGIAPPGTAPAGITITEVLYNPAPATEATWEWIEIYNNTGGDINFEETPYVLDDFSGNLLSNTNVNSGVLLNGQVGVLFNDSLTVTQIGAAWDPNSARDINFIPVSNFQGLTNVGGERIGLWSSLDAYQGNEIVDPRSVDTAVAVLDYGIGGDWPVLIEPGGPSIYLKSFDADPNDGGINWSASDADDAIGSVYVPLNAVLHPGGDVGSPGTFGAAVDEDADFDNDGDVDGLDFLAWQIGFGSGTSHAEGDANGDEAVNAADLAIWEFQYGPGPIQAIAAVPEPTTWLMAWTTLLGLMKGRLRFTSALSQLIFRVSRTR